MMRLFSLLLFLLVTTPSTSESEYTDSKKVKKEGETTTTTLTKKPNHNENDDNDNEDMDRENNSIINTLVEWVRSKPGAFVSSKLEIRRMDESNAESPYGVFVKDAVERNEMLLEIPNECYLAVPSEQVEPLLQDENGNDEPSTMPAYYRNVCRLAKRLQREMKLWSEKESSSNFAPYIAYLETQRPGQIPATWSREGKELLRRVLGGEDDIFPNLNIIDWIDTHFKDSGCIDPNDAFAGHVVAMAVQRGYDTALIPIWDMVNHDNGIHRNNLQTNSLHDDSGIKVWASKHVQKGEELFASYNFCFDCYDIGSDWGTPGIFRDFGFVESYPHIWFFEDRDIWYKVEQQVLREDARNTNHNDSNLSVSFWEENNKIYYHTKEQLAFLQEQQTRLEVMMEMVQDRTQNAAVPEHEWMAIAAFARVLTTDMARVNNETMARNNNDNNDEL